MHQSFASVENASRSCLVEIYEASPRRRVRYRGVVSDGPAGSSTQARTPLTWTSTQHTEIGKYCMNSKIGKYCMNSKRLTSAKPDGPERNQTLKMGISPHSM